MCMLELPGFSFILRPVVTVYMSRASPVNRACLIRILLRFQNLRKINFKRKIGLDKTVACHRINERYCKD